MKRWFIVIGSLALLVFGTAACAGSRGHRAGGPGGAPNPVAVAPAAGCAEPSPSPASTFQPPPTTDPFWQTQATLDDLAARVEALAAQFPDAYAGVALDPEHARLAVYRVPSAAFDTALRREMPDAPLRIVDAAHSARDLRTLLDRVTADRAYWESQGIGLYEFVPLHDGSCVQVGTRDVDAARRLFPQRYGPDAPIRIVLAEPVEAK